MKYKLTYDREMAVWEVRILDENGQQVAIDYSLGNEEKAKDMALWMIENAKTERGKGATIYINDDDTIKVLDPGRLSDYTKRVIACWNAEWITRTERMARINEMLDWIHEQPQRG